MWLVRTLGGNAQVLGLVGGKLCQFGRDAAEMKRRNLFIQMFGQNVDLATFVLGVIALKLNNS